MQTLLAFLAEQENSFKVGDHIKWNNAQVGSYVDIQAMGGFDNGEVISVGNGGYTVKSPNGMEITIKSEDAYAFGDEADYVAP